ncbi:hypothetical protein MMPV_000618 [Pyropia vietnamensis]
MAEPTASAAYLAAVAAALGHPPAYVYRFYAGEPRVMLATPAAVAHVLVGRPGNYVKPRMTVAMLRGLLGGGGLVLAEGATHARLRRALAPLFHHAVVGGFGGGLAADAGALLDAWLCQGVAGGGTTATVAAATASVDKHATIAANRRNWATTTADVAASDRPAPPFVSPHAASAAATAASTTVAADGWVTLPDAYESISASTLAAIGRAALGDTPAANALTRAYGRILGDHTISHGALMAIFLAPSVAHRLPLPEISSRVSRLAVVQGGVRAAVAARRDARRRLAAAAAAAAAATSAEVAGGGGAGPRRVVDQALTFVAAGHATTAIGISWALFLLAGSPDVQARLRDEVLAALSPLVPGGGPLRSLRQLGGAPAGVAPVVPAAAVNSDSSCGSNGSGGVSPPPPPEWTGVLDALPLLDATVRETLRLYPPINITARRVVRDDVVVGVPLPAGTIVSLPMMALGRDPAVWGADATRFRPDRHMDGAVAPGAGADAGAARVAATRRGRAWLPFLAGPRGCIGQRFATLHVKVAVVEAIVRARIALAPGTEPRADGVFLVPHGLGLRVCPR